MAKDKEIAKVEPKGQRDGQGRFLKGWKGGPGNANAITPDRVRFGNILKNSVSDADFEKVAQVLLAQAQSGEPWAIKELLDRLLGKSKQVAEVDLTTHHVDPATVVTQIGIILGLNKEEDAG
jgi:hypothetical protein